jgi:hypothetical protein
MEIERDNDKMEIERDNQVITYFEHNDIKVKKICYYNENKELHSEQNEPAFTEFYDEWHLNYLKEWYKNGILHRENGPARIKSDNNGKLIIEEYYQNGILHSENNYPTTCRKQYHDYGYYSEMWYLNDKLHNIDKPAVIIKDSNDNFVSVEAFVNGKRHRLNGPAHIMYHKYTNKISTQIYYENGKGHRLNGPAVIEFCKDTGNVRTEIYYQHGKRYRPFGLPALIKYNIDDCPEIKASSEEWYQNGVLHRDNDLPAVVEYCKKNKKLWKLKWYQNGKQHRIGQPAYIEYNTYDPQHSIHVEEWYQNGVLHRDNDLPAFIKHYSNNVISSQKWYQNGKIHRISRAPAVIDYFHYKVSNKTNPKTSEDQIICWKSYYQNGELIAIRKYKNNNQFAADAYQDGKLTEEIMLGSIC